MVGRLVEEEEVGLAQEQLAERHGADFLGLGGPAWSADGNRLFAPGMVTDYSNHANGMVGYLIERKTGQPYETWVNNHLLKPIGIHKMRAHREHKVDQQSNDSTRYWIYGSGQPFRTSFFYEYFREDGPKGAKATKVRRANTVGDATRRDAETTELYVRVGSYGHRPLVTPRAMCEHAPTRRGRQESAESQFRGYQWCRRGRTERAYGCHQAVASAA
jgi:CubicO group peptidase (beta-lactamase class C family)